MKPKGFLTLVLHAHLPYIRHPEYEYFMEENWLYEAMIETYLPLLNVYEGLVRDKVDFRITMSLTPPLCHMFQDKLLMDRFEKHIYNLIELIDKEIYRTRNMPEFLPTAEMYKNKLEICKNLFVNVYGKNLLNGFRKFRDLGVLEIITCGATHGFLPLMNIHHNAVNAQVSAAATNYKSIFGDIPKGIWNGECGYYPGLEDMLEKSGIKFFFVDTHGILYADKRPKYGIFAPVYCPNGVAAFGRDVESSKSVWSADEGYPGDFNYREFYRDVGYDLDMDYIKPYIHPDGIRLMTGIKYFKITGNVDLSAKQPYNSHVALDTAASHAGNFMFNREKQIENLASIMDRQPLIISPYDAELFGHWWYEGPDFINFLARKIHHDQNTIKLINPSEYLEQYPVNQVTRPSYSSWGHKGYAEVWLEGSNDWIYKHLHKISEIMIGLANKYSYLNNTGNDRDNLLQRALNQAAREVLLAQSSDWAFIMKTGTTVSYAVKRTREHINRLFELSGMIEDNRIDEQILSELEWKDNIFPEIDFKIYAD